MENNTANVNQENGAPAGKKGLPAYIILGIIALVAAVALAVIQYDHQGPHSGARRRRPAGGL